MTGEIGGSLLVGASTTIADFMLPEHPRRIQVGSYPDVRPRLIVANSETIEHARHAEHMPSTSV
jgi:hypothetical protein